MNQHVTLGAGDARTMQANLQRLGLYLGQLDGKPGALTCDALLRFLAGPNAPHVGRPLAEAIPVGWWAIPARVNMLLAQVNAECAFRSRAEDLNYSTDRLCEVWPHLFGPGRGHAPAAFAGDPLRLADLVYNGHNGNCTPTDGWTFRGRGWPQLTGRANYRAYSDVAGVDLERNPDAALLVDVTARITVAFMQRTPGMVAAADAANVAQVRHLWNGGANGLQCASDSFDKLQMLWGLK